ncbi:PREDICTED: zinc finger CCCH domain-containing protein 19 isoform X2 [Ipomoea nil]|uniref:zinc finger CCCH domain-containing protein 19 isoform X2 n=1 Tax=Ipomoea nil TaxID=35883 RepID=UPI00090182F3|nr:PREDICTED: zinc finger CCCH domain-containing protein 19 isoform X2 [Ipomoea nil]
MADGEVTVSNVDKPLLEEVNGGDDLTETEQCVSLPESKVLNEASTESPGIQDASTAETKMKTEAEGGEDAVVDTIDSRNEAGAGEETVVHTIDSRNEAGAREETVVDTIDSRNEAGGGEENVVGMSDSLKEPGVVEETVDTSDSRKEAGAGEETVVDTSDSRKEAGGGEKTVLDTNDSRKEAGVDGEETVACTSDSHNEAGGGEETVVDMNNSHVAEVAPVLISDAEMEAKANEQTEMAAVRELELDGGDETVVDMGQSHTELVPKAAPVLELVQFDIKPGLDIEFEAPIAVAVTERSQLDDHHSEAVDAMEAEIPTGEANRELEIDGENTTKIEEDAAASIPTSEANREMETDGQDTMKAEDNDTDSIPPTEANREMETDKMDITKAEDGEASSVPTGEANRKLETDKKDITKAEDGESVSIPSGESNRELESDGDEVMKTEDDEAASVPTGEANRELETDGDDVMKAEDVEAASISTEEANGELVADEEDIMLEDSQEDPQYGENEVMTAEETAAADTEVETETDAADSGRGAGGKRKRGKNSKSPASSKAATRTPSRKVTEEDVCFICFDGGDLVLCDRRGCPKAYHPSCVNRDEAFFRAKGRWNCGWHLCSICEKNANYMCYTCTYSLCKGCIKSAVILCIRGNKGFCENCMRTVKLIESKQQGDKDAQIDFDDKSSWEYLFKDYYMDLKERLSLSSAEIAEAKSPWKGSDVSGNRQQQSEPQFDNNEEGGSGSDNSGEKVEVNKLKRRKVTKKSKSLLKEDGMASMSVIAGSEGASTPSNTEWASKELLDFVKHMKNGDTSVLSQFDVQDLLLKYIQMNKLRIPNKKSQIMCDSRLQSLFGKPRVGHFEMLKLLESHFLIKEDTHIDDAQGTVVDTEVEGDENRDTLMKEVKDKKRKRKKGHSRGPQSNLDDYAAIDMHNIGLIYLRRKLMEDLLEDVEKFQDKVVGTFVRIRISGNNQKQDLYRLVQVMGMSKASEPYKVGKRTTDILLEILNLNKTEVISIDTISNQDFTEDECKRLRQSIKCGLINRPTVGVILDKAMEIHEARVNDWLESEVLRLSHLRDRASEKGRRKELRECVEKLELLKTPEERQRRLDEIPEIHADPNMDPSYESEDDDSVTDENRRDTYMRSRDSSFSRRGREPISPRSNYSSKDPWGSGGKTPTRSWELDRNLSSKNTLVKAEDSTHNSEMVNENSWGLGRDRDQESRSLEKVNSTTNSETIGRKGNSLSRPEMASGVASMTSTVTPTAKSSDTGIKINETEKIWHYKDPSGKIQGPFSMVQLRKWNNTGYFPANLRIWRSTEKQDDSILLTDALAGRFLKESSVTEHRNLAGGVLQNREAERLNLDQNRASQNSPSGLVSSRGGMISGEMSGVPKEKWDGNDSSNLPSPTPKQGNSGWTGDAVPVTAATSYPVDNGISEPSRLVLPANVSSLLASAVNASGHSLMRSENVSSNSGAGFSPMTNTANPQSSQLTAVSEPPQMIVHSQHATATQDANVHPVQSINNIQNPNLDPHALGVGQTLKAEPNISVPTPAQPQGYGNWGGITSAVQNLAASFSNTGALPLPQSEFWRPQSQANQPNIQLPSVPSFPWGAGIPQNSPAPANLNAVWGTMQQGNPNMGWSGPAPGTMNMNWGAPVQTMAPPNPGWVMPPGPMPGNMNPGWVAPTAGNPGVQGMAPGNPNPGWVAPTVSGPRDNGSQGGDTGFNDGRPWNRQSSFGSGGHGGGPRGNFLRSQKPCPYNTNGRCRKGARCDYLHI